jgi:hypothetical protein
MDGKEKTSKKEKKMKSDEKNYYYVEDIQKFLDLGITASYRRIREMNKDLEAQGYLTKTRSCPTGLF